MLRSLSRIPLRSIAAPSLYESGGESVASKLEGVRGFTALSGHGCVGDGREPKGTSLQAQIVDALSQGNRSRASNLLLDLSRGGYALRADDFVYILAYCARSSDPLFVMETWKIMGEKGVDMDEKCFIHVIRALCKGGYLKEAFNLMNILEEDHDIHPTLPMFNNFLGACARVQSLNHAKDCLDLMEKRMVGKNEVTYAELLKLAVLQKNLSAAHEIWEEYVKNYSLSIISLRKFVHSFSRLRDLESAYNTLLHMVALAVQGSFIISRTTEGKFYSSRLDIPVPLDSDLRLNQSFKENKISQLSPRAGCTKMDVHASNSEQSTFGSVKEERKTDGLNMPKKLMDEPVMKILRWSFNDVIHCCAKTMNYSLAQQLVLQMQNLGLEPSRHTYDGFIRAIVSEKGFLEGMEQLKVMLGKNLKPLDSTLATISTNCSKCLELDIAQTFLDQISSCPYTYPYNAFLEACDALDQPERAVRVLAKLKEMRLQPDIRTYELLFSLFGNVNAPYEDGNMLSQVDVAKRINAIETDMMNNGIQHSPLSMKNLLRALGEEGMIRELMEYLRVAEQLSHANSCLGTPLYNTVLHSLVEAKKSRMAIDIFKTMKSCGFLPDGATYNIMIDCCSTIRCFRSACALVSLMIRDGFNPQKVTYTALIKILLTDEAFDEALNLLDQLSLEGIQCDVLLFNTILLEASEKGRLDVIELIVEWMHREKIQPDSSTCDFVFSAYTNQGFFTTAMEALQVLSMRMIAEEENTLEEKRRDFEEGFILAEDSEAELRIIHLFKDFKENLAVALLNLRWCAMFGYQLSWLPNQSLWAKRLATNYISRKSGF